MSVSGRSCVRVYVCIWVYVCVGVWVCGLYAHVCMYRWELTYMCISVCRHSALRRYTLRAPCFNMLEYMFIPIMTEQENDVKLTGRIIRLCFFDLHSLFYHASPYLS